MQITYLHVHVILSFLHSMSQQTLSFCYDQITGGVLGQHSLYDIHIFNNYNCEQPSHTHEKLTSNMHVRTRHTSFTLQLCHTIVRYVLIRIASYCSLFPYFLQQWSNPYYLLNSKFCFKQLLCSLTTPVIRITVTEKYTPGNIAWHLILQIQLHHKTFVMHL